MSIEKCYGRELMLIRQQQQIGWSHPVRAELETSFYSLVRAADMHLSPEMQSAWEQLQVAYADLPPDNHLPNGGSYRYRRYDSFALEPRTGDLPLLPHEDYFQDTDINTVTGGIIRQFAPLTEEIASNPFLHELVRADFAQFPVSDEQLDGEWQVDVHLIRVVAQAGETGQPTPEGVHRDGAAYVTVHLAELESVTGGVVSVYSDDRDRLASFTLETVGDVYFFRDEVLWHGVTPIRPINQQQGVRSILTFDFHAPHTCTA